MADQRFSAAGLSPRLATGSALAVLLLAVWRLGGTPLFLLIATVAVIGQWECCSLFLPGAEYRRAKILAAALGAGYVAARWFLPQWPGQLALTAAVLILALHHLAGWRQEQALSRLRRDAALAGSLLYVPLLLAPALHFSPMEQLLVVAVPALSDMAAFFVGVRFGRHRIWPAVSPKKSMEGAAAGLLAAVLTCCGLGLARGSAPLALFVPLGLALGVAAQLGDFFESALKRATGVKDSGKLLPGHGGILDRIDSILFASGAYAVASSCITFFG